MGTILKVLIMAVEIRLAILCQYLDYYCGYLGECQRHCQNCDETVLEAFSGLNGSGFLHRGFDCCPYSVMLSDCQRLCQSKCHKSRRPLHTDLLADRELGDSLLLRRRFVGAASSSSGSGSFSRSRRSGVLSEGVRD